MTRLVKVVGVENASKLMYENVNFSFRTVWFWYDYCHEGISGH